MELTAPAAADAFLDAWSMLSFGGEPAPPARRRSAAGGPLSIAGRRFARGIGARAPSRIEYELDGAFEWLEAVPGIDAAARFQGSVVFAVEVDGTERWRSPVIRGGGEDEAIRVPLERGRRLALILEDGGDGAADDIAVWGDARVIAAR